MAVLEVMKTGHPVLKQIAEPVEFVNKKIRQLLDDMAETMYKIIVLDDGNGLIEVINPEIVKKEGSQVGLEGCLSVPELFGDVERYDKIEVHGINRNNKKIKIKAEGFLARIFQHEIDHLNGILFVEKLVNPNEIFIHKKEQQ